MSKINIPLHTYFLSYSQEDYDLDITENFNLLENIYLFTYSRFKKILLNENVLFNIALNIKTEKKYREFFLYSMANIYIDMRNFLQRKDHAFYFWIYDNEKIGVVSVIENENLIAINDALVYSKYKGYKEEHLIDFCLGLCSYGKTVVFPDDIISIKENGYLISHNIVLKENKIDFDTNNNNDLKILNSFKKMNDDFYFIMNNKEKYNSLITDFINDKQIININNINQIFQISSMKKNKNKPLKDLLRNHKSLIKDLNKYYNIPHFLKGNLR